MASVTLHDGSPNRHPLSLVELGPSARGERWPSLKVLVVVKASSRTPTLPKGRLGISSVLSQHTGPERSVTLLEKKQLSTGIMVGQVCNNTLDKELNGD